MKIELSKDVLRDAIAHVVAKRTAGMASPHILEVRAVVHSGHAFDFDRIEVELAPATKPQPAPREARTATGRLIRLATSEGVRI